MPRFVVPVAITLTARNADHARNTIECSSLHSLEIPGLMRIAVGDAARAHRTIQRSRRPQASVTELHQRLLALLSTEQGANPLVFQVLELAKLLQEGTDVLADLVQTALSPDCASYC